MNNCSIVIADDHPLFRKGLKEYLAEEGFSISGEAGDGEKALSVILELQPDIAILDINMPGMDGLSVAKECGALKLPTKIIVLSYHKESEFIAHAQSLNISGYLIKEDALSEISSCIRQILEGKNYYSVSLDDSETKSINSRLSQIQQLTPSELKILKLIAGNKSNREIADMLFISERTVEKHRSNIIEKLDIRKKTHGLMEWVMQYRDILQNLWS